MVISGVAGERSPKNPLVLARDREGRCQASRKGWALGSQVARWVGLGSWLAIGLSRPEV